MRGQRFAQTRDRARVQLIRLDRTKDAAVEFISTRLGCDADHTASRAAELGLVAADDVDSLMKHCESSVPAMPVFGSAVRRRCRSCFRHPSNRTPMRRRHPRRTRCRWCWKFFGATSAAPGASATIDSNDAAAHRRVAHDLLVDLDARRCAGRADVGADSRMTLTLALAGRQTDGCVHGQRRSATRGCRVPPSACRLHRNRTTRRSRRPAATA